MDTWRISPPGSLLCLMIPHPVHTLIADDSEDDRLLFERALRSHPLCQTIAAVEDGVEAIAYLAGFGRYSNRQRFPFPGLLLLDFQMPGYNGVEVLAWIRKQVRQPKVVLWSNSVELLQKNLPPDLTADIVCAKPQSKSEMLEILHHLSISNRVAPTLAGTPRPQKH